MTASDLMAAPVAEGGGRRLHPLTLGFSAAGIARSMIWPALVGGFSLGSGDLDRFLPVFLAVLAVPALAGAALKYAFYRWRLTGEELVLRSGVLNRQNRVIPFSRVQNVEVRQSLLQRVFSVAELRVETAGAGAQAEAVLSVLAVGEAQAARAELLAHRRGAVPAAVANGVEAADRQAVPPLAALTTRDVLRAGATANEAGVIAAALAGVLGLVDDVPLPFIESAAERIFSRAAAGWVGFAAAALVFFVVFGWLISIVGAFVRYHGFTLSIADGEMRKRYGLLTLHEASVPMERVQAVRVQESMVRRMFGLASLSIETAGGTPGTAGGAEAFVPITRGTEVARLVRGVFADAEYDGVEFQPVHPAARWRILRGYLAVFALVWAPFWAARWFEVQPAGQMAPWLVLVLPLLWMLSEREYRGRGWALAPGYVLVRAAVLSRVTWIVPDRKLQTLHLKSNPFQRRRGLATLVIDTAAGGRVAIVEDLDEATGRRLLDEMAARVRAAQAARVEAARRVAAAAVAEDVEDEGEAADAGAAEDVGAAEVVGGVDDIGARAWPPPPGPLPPQAARGEGEEERR